MGNKICCEERKTESPLQAEEVKVQNSNNNYTSEPPKEENENEPEMGGPVQETIQRERFFENERNTQNNAKTRRYGNDFYSGDLDENGQKPNGFGKMHKQDGSVYMGYFDHGRAHGRGAYIFPNGAYYEGDFHHNTAHSENGKYSSDEMTYEGGFKDSKFDGQCVERGNGYEFRGDYAEGSRRYGKLRWQAENGEYIYEGPFNEYNQFHGKGTLQEPIGRYNGPFVNGEKEGDYGEYYSDNGTVYKGSYVNGYREGSGTVYNNEGQIAYKGEMKEGLPHGTGSIYKNDKEMKTTWVQGIDYNLLPESQK